MHSQKLHLIANWKSHHTISQSLYWLDQLIKLKPRLTEHLQITICLPFIDLAEFNRRLSSYNFPLVTGAQNVSQYSIGKHTGEITASMLSELVSYCIVGHSERRKQFQETSDQVAQKAEKLQKHFITPIICLDVPYLEEQVKALLFQKVELSKCIFVYEPITAIGSGKPTDPASANRLADRISFLTQPEVSVLYGGSVTAQNVHQFTSQPAIDGVLVGTDSLNPQDFANIINVLSQSN